ncbi:MAG: hypothetical protein SFW67_26675 [Myxococcaceae bacterium]|nr:hypothetical protein [Myxococcaceae bacterium]
MAFLGKIGNFVKPFVGNIVKAVAPKAAEALKGIAGGVIKDLFSKGAGALKGLVSQIPFVGPLAGGLVDKLAPKLSELAQRLAGTGIDRLLQMITGSNTARPVPGAAPNSPPVTTPTINNPVRTETAANNTPTSSTNASTGAGGNNGTIGQGGAGLSGVNVGDTKPNSKGYKWDGGSMPNPDKYNMENPADAAAFQRDMAKYQQAMNNISLYWQTLSNVLKAQNDTAQSIGRNVR